MTEDELVFCFDERSNSKPTQFLFLSLTPVPRGFAVEQAEGEYVRDLVAPDDAKSPQGCVCSFTAAIR
jgi:hypothetical protein